MSKFVVCWNDDAFAKNLNEYVTSKEGKKFLRDDQFCVCTSWLKFVSEVDKADYFIVLCELNWDGEPMSEFKGISYVQQFLRSEKGVLAPIVFTSFLSPKMLVNQMKDAEIVMTPALGHLFLQLPIASTPKEIITEFYSSATSMEKLDDDDLAYTRMFYCDLQGLLRVIHHSLRDYNSTDESVEQYREKNSKQISQIKYIIEHHFQKKKVLLEELDTRNDLHSFCNQLIASWNPETEDTASENDKKSEVKNRVKIRILYLEDNTNEENVRRFKQYCDISKDFELTILSNVDDIGKVLDIGSKYYFAEYNAVICDIEIRDKDGVLRYLGYDLIKAMAKKSVTPLFYIVTNMSRSVYDQIKPSIVKRIMLKSEAFGDNESIGKFLGSIKKLQTVRTKKQNEQTKPEEIFYYFYQRLKNDKYRFIISYKSIEGGTVEEDLRDFSTLNSFVNDEALKLYDYFLDLIKDGNNGSSLCDFELFNRCCKTMRDKISDTMQRGNKNFEGTDQSMNPSEEDLRRIVKILILRRFFLCVLEFVKSNDILNSLNTFREKKLIYNDAKLHYNNRNGESSKNQEQKRGFTNNDLAFRAISDQYKTMIKKGYIHNTDVFLFGDNGTEVTKGGNYRPQSRLNATLLWGNSTDLKLTEEEAAFKSSIPPITAGKSNSTNKKKSNTKKNK
ncbi:MAG: hypothetical protein K6F40_02035 [Bacteroidales bacterium]|nr:hypothetical protein [Bacteroidales bacterium]